MANEEVSSLRGRTPHDVRGSYSVPMTDLQATPLRALVEARRDEIKAIVARHHGRSVAIFGSVARGDERPGSDIDFLVELAPGARPFELLSIGAELEEALGVRVDVGTPDSLRERLRDEVLAEAVAL
jgi:predicted nucleotidyltransferase